ncbi:MAG: methylated-DNA--[protein]-cysteine S-methyltransferase, partial [Flavobacteriales bacterium]|nr:methylated-DNA--[protein]-cysteine S-methyltransferase [Flavobacteriales bacterium]
EAEFVEQESKILKNVKVQLTEYFNGERTEFDIPLLFVGSNFQKSVWNALLQIPFGKTQTYLGLSRILKNEKAIRAVASANGANAISILVPCHRIIGSNGDLVGYAGGLEAKKRLLSLEGALVESQLSLFED